MAESSPVGDCPLLQNAKLLCVATGMLAAGGAFRVALGGSQKVGCPFSHHSLISSLFFLSTTISSCLLQQLNGV